MQWCGVFLTEPKYGGPRGLLLLAHEARHGETQAKQIAARRVLRARRMRWGKSGKPLSHDDLEGILDRDLGKPTQSLQVETTIQTLPEAEADLVAVFRADRLLLMTILDRITDQIPGLRAEIAERMAPRLPVIDTTAEARE